MRLSYRRKLTPKCFQKNYKKKNKKCLRCQHQKYCREKKYKKKKKLKYLIKIKEIDF